MEVILIDIIIARNANSIAERIDIYGKARQIMARLIQSKPDHTAKYTMSELDTAINIVEEAFQADHARLAEKARHLPEA